MNQCQPGVVFSGQIYGEDLGMFFVTGITALECGMLALQQLPLEGRDVNNLRSCYTLEGLPSVSIDELLSICTRIDASYSPDGSVISRSE
jgi:hypothetical protein